ncbi:hypothetical protein GQR58_024481 [Nymphon striatum]|nr:hypothetical protein GQR58_024481 [Nymphon striatum]
MWGICEYGMTERWSLRPERQGGTDTELRDFDWYNVSSEERGRVLVMKCVMLRKEGQEFIEFIQGKLTGLDYENYLKVYVYELKSNSLKKISIWKREHLKASLILLFRLLEELEEKVVIFTKGSTEGSTASFHCSNSVLFNVPILQIEVKRSRLR